MYQELDVAPQTVAEMRLQKKSWNWIEGAFQRIPAPYLFISAIASIMLYGFYMLLISKVEFLQDATDLYANIIALDTFVIIAYLLSGIQYFITKAKRTFRKLDVYPDNESYPNTLYDRLEKRFISSKSYYAIVMLIIVFYITVPLPTQSNFLYFSEPGAWTASIDIINFAATVLVLYLISTVLWIMFNISWLLDQMQVDFEKGILKVDLFSSDNVGGLKPIRDLVTSLVVYHFIAISLAIINFIVPGKIFYPEIAFFVLLFLAGVYFFFKGWHTIDMLLEDKRRLDIRAINRIYERESQHAMEIISSESYENSEEKLDQVYKSMEWLEKEGQKIMKASPRAYDFKTIFAFISTSLLPFLTTYIIPFASEGSKQNEFIMQMIKLFIPG